MKNTFGLIGHWAPCEPIFIWVELTISHVIFSLCGRSEQRGIKLAYGVEMYFMKLTKTPFLLLLSLCTFAIFFSSCSKKESSGSGKARMQIFLTDDPAPYEAVIIDVQDIRINYSTDTASGWTSLANVNRGSYDLLKLVNDKDTLLADAELNT